MHIKTNVEMSFVHIIILAICPLMLVMTNLNQALYYVAATAVCFLISAFVCLVFNKYLSNTVKIFIVAVLSTFLVTVFNYAVETYKILGLTVQENSFFAVITTIVLSADIVYIDTKAKVNNFFSKLLLVVVLYAVLTLTFAAIKEFLAFGTILGKQLFVYKGYEFFKTITFDLILLGLICFVAEFINRAITKRVNEKRVTYQKFIKKIRNEKVFQYDTLRRKKLLISEIDTNRIDGDKIEEIKEKESENEVVEAEEKANPEEEIQPQKPKKKNKKMNFSKETKVEKVYDRQSKEDN